MKVSHHLASAWDGPASVPTDFFDLYDRPVEVWESDPHYGSVGSFVTTANYRRKRRMDLFRPTITDQVNIKLTPLIFVLKFIHSLGVLPLCQC